MIKITIIAVKVDESFVENHYGFTVGATAYAVYRMNGKRISVYYHTELLALGDAWSKVKQFGLTLVEPWEMVFSPEGGAEAPLPSCLREDV